MQNREHVVDIRLTSDSEPACGLERGEEASERSNDDGVKLMMLIKQDTVSER